MMTNGWSWYVIALTVLNILAMLWLLLATSKSNDMDESSTTGHKWDGIEELNNPLPRWWFGLFILTIVFSVAYLYVYPGLGNYAGSFGWSQTSQFEQAVAQNRVKQDRFFSEFSELDIPTLANNKKAMQTGHRLFLNNCSTCHGSGAQGAKGFPNLKDDDWLYGNSPEVVLESITNGRAGVMPNFNLPKKDIPILSRYVKSLAGYEITPFTKDRGEAVFGLCATCHGADGKGNQALGAPNLTDDIWLHGSSLQEIESILVNGKQANMPSFDKLLSKNEIKLLAAYVLSLSERE